MVVFRVPSHIDRNRGTNQAFGLSTKSTQLKGFKYQLIQGCITNILLNFQVYLKIQNVGANITNILTIVSILQI